MTHSTDIDINVGRSRLTILSIVLALFLFGTGMFASLGQQARSAGKPSSLGGYFISQFWQPALWIEGAPDPRLMTPDAPRAP